MADFCNECADWFGIPHGDLAGIISEEDTANGVLAVALCERCGVITVDHKGNKVNEQ